MPTSPEKIDSATLPASLRATIEDAARHDSFVVIERAGQMVGVVVSPRDYALLLQRKQALADLRDIVDAIRTKFADLPEDVAIARAEAAALSVRDELRSAHTTPHSPDHPNGTN